MSLSTLERTSPQVTTTRSVRRKWLAGMLIVMCFAGTATLNANIHHDHGPLIVHGVVSR